MAVKANSNRGESDFSSVLKHRDRIYGYIASMLPALQDAEDVFQQTCLVLWEKIEHYDSEREFLPWAFGIARNEVRRFIRENSRERNFFSDEVLESIAAAMAERGDDIDRGAALEQCLTKLDERQRAMLMQNYAGERRKEDIASDFGVTIDALYMRLHRLRRTLLECVIRRLSLDS